MTIIGIENKRTVRVCNSGLQDRNRLRNFGKQLVEHGDFGTMGHCGKTRGRTKDNLEFLMQDRREGTDTLYSGRHLQNQIIIQV